MNHGKTRRDVTRPRQSMKVIAAVAALVLAGCATNDPLADMSQSGPQATIVVGSANFPESEAIAEVYAGALGAAGHDVRTHTGIGAREATMGALQDGSITLMPEYAGNLLQYLDPDTKASDVDDVAAGLESALPTTLTALTPAPAEDADRFVVTRERADADGLRQIGDLARLEGVKVGAAPEFAQRPYGIPGLKSVYGVDATLVPINDGGGPSTVKALRDGDVDVADIYSTSSALASEDLVVLEDPKGMVSAQNIVPLIVRAQATPDVVELLDRVSAQLRTEDLLDMNRRMDQDRASARQVAADWLRSRGFAK